MTQDRTQPDGSLLKGDQIVFQPVPLKVPVAGPAPASAPRQPAGEPEVELTRAPDGTITAITVRCPCGRHVTLECEYSDRGGTDEQDRQ